LLERLLQSKKIIGEETITLDAIFLLYPGAHDHVINPGMGEPSQTGILDHQIKIFLKGALPGKLVLFSTVLFQTCKEIHIVHPPLLSRSKRTMATSGEIN